MGLISSLWTSMFGGASSRSVGIQLDQPSTGRLTTRTVTSETALQLSAVFACVRLLAETVAGLPLNFYRVDANGAKKADLNHPLYRLMSMRPNRYQTKIEFFETLVMQLALHGNAYCKIDRSAGKIVSLLPLMSNQMQVDLQDDGAVLYRYESGGALAIYAPASIWHLKLFGNGIIGISPLNYARNSIGIAISAEDRVSKLANSGFKPAGVLMIDKILTPEQRAKIRAQFKDLAEGGEDTLRVLEAGMKYEQVSMNPKDVQFLEARRFQVEDVARFFGVPSVLINDTSATTVWGSGIQQIIGGFYKLGLRPYLERIEGSIVNWLLDQTERRIVMPEFDFDTLLRGDEPTRFATYDIAIRSGVKTINECRAQEGLTALPGGDEPRAYSPGGGNNENKKADLK